MKAHIDKFIGFCDGLTKIAGAFLVFIAICSAIPIASGPIKAVTGWLFGIQGAVYYEIGPNDDAMFASVDANGDEVVDGGLFLLRDGNRDFSDLSWGDILQAGTEKNFRSWREIENGKAEDGAENVNIPKIFVLREGECVVVLSPIKERPPKQAKSGGWLRVATTACGLFR